MHFRTTARRLLVGGVALAAVSFPAIALGQQDDQGSFSADLSALNDSGATGSVDVQVQNGQVTVMVTTNDVAADLPHAQHIHIGGQNECPSPSLDSNGDGLVSSAEGQSAYGPAMVSLTTSGDTSSDSAVAVDRFPTADNSGTYTYQRTFDLPNGVSADDLQNGVVVVHGLADEFGDPDQYDGDPRSSLDDSLPLEATLPIMCGQLSAATAGNGTPTASATAAGTTTTVSPTAAATTPATTATATTPSTTATATTPSTTATATTPSTTATATTPATTATATTPATQGTATTPATTRTATTTGSNESATRAPNAPSTGDSQGTGGSGTSAMAIGLGLVLMIGGAGIATGALAKRR